MMTVGILYGLAVLINILSIGSGVYAFIIDGKSIFTHGIHSAGRNLLKTLGSILTLSIDIFILVMVLQVFSGRAASTLIGASIAGGLVSLIILFHHLKIFNIISVFRWIKERGERINR